MLSLVLLLQLAWDAGVLPDAARGWLTGLCVVALCATLYFWHSLHRAVLQPLQRARQACDVMAGGDQGRGFAVVAGEVRSLAQRSASAATEIKQLITASLAQVQAGAKLAQQAGASSAEMLGAVQGVHGIMEEIASASREQSHGIGQVNMAVTQMDEVTQQNAALVEESAAASASLQDQTLQLEQAMAQFKPERRRAIAGALTRP